MRLRLACLLFVLAAPAWAGPDRDTVLSGVTEVIAPGAVPGPVVAVGERAEVLLAAKLGGARAPLAALTRYGRGRAAAMGHGGFFGAEALPHEDNRRLLDNLLTWLADGQAKPSVGLLGAEWLRAPLTAAGCRVEVLAPQRPLPPVQVVALDSGELPAATIAALARFVEQGGGLLATSCPWGWLQLNPGRDLRTDLGANRVLARMGLVFAEGYLSGPYRADTPTDLLDTTTALAAVTAPGDKAATAQATATLSLALGALPEDDALLLPKLAPLLAGAAATVPTEKSPVTAAQPLARLAIARRVQAAKSLPPEQVTADPAAAAFPGLVPADAPRVTRTIPVDTRVPDWHSTGLYAPAGSVVEVSLPADAAKLGLGVRIGAHTDSLWTLDRWQRLPELSLYRPLTSATTRVASPVGGLLYLVVPSQAAARTVEVTVAGAVEAPWFVAGQTPLAAWREAIRNRPAPWAELQSGKVILTVPSTVVRTLDDPAALMAFWDTVLDADADLAGRPRERRRPERYTTDVQISAGYMHSGYPIMTHLDAAPRFVDLPTLASKGDWGMFHEMGHNHQSPAWTFDGTTEVTVNLFTLYTLETVCAVPVAGGRVFEPKLAAQVKAYLARPSFETWKREPFVALTMYAQLQQAFGWDAFKQVFAAYRDAPASELPKTDDARRDQWLVRFSRQVGRNLGPFFVAWGVPTSAAARASVADLPEWLPAEMK